MNEIEPLTPGARLRGLLGGRWIAAAICAAARLGIPDALRAPRTVDELARTISVQPEPLARLLRVLAGEGVVSSSPRGVWSLTEVGMLLQSDELGPLVAYLGRPETWDVWSNLPDAIRTGTSAFELRHGASLFEWLDTRPEERAAYHAGVDAFTRRQARALVEAFDFSAASMVVDVGGGRGVLLEELVRRWPSTRGVLFDRPEVVADAEDRLSSHPTIDLAPGDFFESVPSGDVMVLKHVLHNWDDDDVLRILSRVREALPPDGHLLIIEALLLPGDRRGAARFMDLEMLAFCEGGHERSKPEFRRLVARAGLSLVRTPALAEGTRLLVCSRRS